MIQNILIELGRVDLIEEIDYKVYEYWNKLEKRREEVDYSFSKIKGSNGINYSAIIEDEGFYNQQQGIVSSIHPRQDENVIPFNVEYCQDRMETGAEIRVELAIEKFKNAIIKAIEKGVRL